MNYRHKIEKLSDEELLHHFQKENNVDFIGELYRRYIPLTYGLCLKYLKDSNAAHDAIMDIFEDLTKKVSHYEINNFRTWLYSVAKNHCLQVLRKEKETQFVNLENAFVENEDFFTLIDKPQNEEEIAALLYCMKSLTEKQQKSISLFYIEEKSYADIVDITGYTLNNVKSFIQNGKRNLKSCIIKILDLN